MKKRTIILILLSSVAAICLALGLSACAAGGGEPPHEHTYKLVQRVNATCVSEGVAEHYLCEGCGKTFDSAHREADSENFIIKIDKNAHAYGTDNICDLCEYDGCIDYFGIIPKDGGEPYAVAHSKASIYKFAKQITFLREYAGMPVKYIGPDGYSDVLLSEYARVTKVVIPEGVEEVRCVAFSKCPNLEEVVIPSTLKTITANKSLCASCPKLETVYFNAAEFKCGSYMLFPYCDALKKAVFGETVKTVSGFNYSKVEECVFEEGLENIGTSAFANCKNLTSISLPQSVVLIDDGAFSGCEKLAEIDLGGAQSIGERAFYDCALLATPDLSKVVKIGKNAFTNCSALTSLSLSAGCDVGDRAFSASGITELTIARNSKIDASFIDCNRLKKVVFTGGDCDIAACSFNGCVKIEEVRAPSIADWLSITFCAEADTQVYNEERASPTYYSRKLYLGDGDIQVSDVVIPEGVTEIGRYAFVGIEDLSRLTLPSTLVKIGRGAFYRCDSLTRGDYIDVTKIAYSLYERVWKDPKGDYHSLCSSDNNGGRVCNLNTFNFDLVRV